MTIRGHVESGRIVLDQEAVLPEGTKVEIKLLTEEQRSEESTAIPTLYECFKDVIGKAKGLPSDFAENHDHYIHGAPKNR